MSLRSIKLTNLLRDLFLDSIDDIIYYFPKRYKEVTVVKSHNDVVAGKNLAFKAQIGIPVYYPERKRLVKVKLNIEGKEAFACWFNQPYKKNQILKLRPHAYFAGEAVLNNRELVFYHPILSKDPIYLNSGIYPEYCLETNDNEIRKIIKNVFDEKKEIKETLPESLIYKLKLMKLKDALYTLHFPKDLRSLESARKRIAFDELLQWKLTILTEKQKFSSKSAPILNPESKLVKKFLSSLPFALTEDQKRVIDEIFSDVSKNKPMQRLLQGDVGSGKTVIAVSALLCAVSSGFQSAFMVPSEILSKQHYEKLREWLKPMGVKIYLLTGSTKKSERNLIIEEINKGIPLILTGTHALITEGLELKNLGLVVIDEQHRFGVRQRLSLIEKGICPHTLVMTATPIPRTLASIFYADLDYSEIRTMPEGRKEIVTKIIHKSDIKKLYSIIRENLKKYDSRVFYVCPLIEDSNSLKLESVKKRYKELVNIFPEFEVGLIHGKLSQSEQDKIMQDFKAGKIKILVSTTVIEVGIDIPQANIMVIENPERFGLAQLHQLRGRIGRGNLNSTCYLLVDEESYSSRRIQIFEKVKNGFELAEKDLELRGQGEIIGSKQSGLDETLKVANPLKDADIMRIAQKVAELIISKDPDLTRFKELKLKMEKTFKDREVIKAI
ncbi:MAG: DNA helicase RecG [Thermodesulfobium narugense]|nr:MAG: DNA helicase RecG [Thermodesulfobium narugense]